MISLNGELIQIGQYNKIKFHDVNGHTLRYSGGASREALHPTLWRSRHFLPLSRNATPHIGRNPARRCLCLPRQRSISRSRRPRRLNKDGKKAFLLAEGNTPACDIHLIRNLENPFRSPWFMTDGSEKKFLLSHPLQSNRLEAQLSKKLLII